MRPFRFRLKNRLALSDKPLTLGEEIDSSSSNNTITDNHNSGNVMIITPTVDHSRLFKSKPRRRSCQ